MYNALVNMNCFLNELRCNEASVKRDNGYHMKCTVESVCLPSSACAVSPNARQGRGREEKKMKITSARCGRAWSCARLNSTHCIAIPPSLYPHRRGTNQLYPSSSCCSQGKWKTLLWPTMTAEWKLHRPVLPCSFEQETIRLWVELLTDMDLDTAEATQA